MAGEPTLDLKAVFELWMDSPVKVQLVAFFHRNPGIVETVEGLARRIGGNADQVRKSVADHVKIGFLKERQLDTRKVIVFDRAGEERLQEYVTRRVKERGAAKS